MRHLGRLVIGLLGAVNFLFTALLLGTAYSPYLQPTEHPVLSCLGLAFPIFLLINVGFLLFWLIIQQYKCALLPLVGFLLCIPQIQTYCPVNFGADDPPEEGLKLISYNIMGFGDRPVGKGPENEILVYLKDSGADILCLQEYATKRTSRHPSQRDVDKALSAYPYRRIDIVGKDRVNSIACYSKLPILSAHPLDYASSANGTMVYELAWGNDTLLLINNHLESNKLTQADKEVYEDLLNDPEKEKVKSGARLLLHKLAEASAIRAPQADAIAREIARSPHRYIVACGDFNDSPISYTHRVIAAQMEDAFTQSGCGLGISYHRNKFYFRIDHILNSPGLRACRCKVNRQVKASDHYPVECHIVRER